MNPPADNTTPSPTQFPTPFPSPSTAPSFAPSPTLHPATRPSPTPSPVVATSCGCYINGDPFIDTNGNGKQDNGELYYDFNNSKILTFSLFYGNGTFIEQQTQNAANSQNPYWYTFNKLQPNQTYKIRLDTIVGPEYTLTTPQEFIVTVGPACNTGGNLDAKCVAAGDVVKLDFGLIPNPTPTDTPIPTPSGNGSGNGNGASHGYGSVGHNQTPGGSVSTPTPTQTQPTTSFFGGGGN